MELETSGPTMGLLSTFSSVTPPWGIGKWLRPTAGQPPSLRAAAQRVKAGWLFLLLLFSFNPKEQKLPFVRLIVSSNFFLFLFEFIYLF